MGAARRAPAPIQFAGGALILVGVVLVRLQAEAPSEDPAEETEPSVPLYTPDQGLL